MENYRILSNGIKMPSIGFGTYKVGNENETINAVKYALNIGYRHIDTAAKYENEKAIGKAMVHWPTELNSETWRAFEELYEAITSVFMSK